MAVSDYSTTPGSNTAISGINIAEGCPPANVNNAIRQLMADIKGYTATVIPFTPAGGIAATTVAAAIAEARADAIAAIPGVATESTAGLLSSTDKAKLNGIAAGAGVTAAIASQSDAQAGSDNAKTMTPLRVEQHMLANALGWGQSWESPSRAIGTTYTNSTGRPILVFVDIFTATAPGSALIFEVSQDGSNWVEFTRAVYGSFTGSVPPTCIPGGHQYRIRYTAGSSGASFDRWRELR